MMNRRFTRHRPLFSSPAPRDAEKPKIKWRILPFLWGAFKRLCFFIGFSVFMSALIGVYTASFFGKQGAAPALPKEMVLYAEFNADPPETIEEIGFGGSFAPPPLTARAVVDAIDRAAADPRVKGMMARIEGAGMSLAHTQEIRAAVKRLRAAGKFAHVYTPTIGAGASGLGQYYLASAFEQIWMQPLGVVSIGGIRAEIPYFRGTLDKIGARPQFYKRHEYKTAYESVTNTAISPENRQMVADLVGDIKAQLLAEIPADRGISAQEFEIAVDLGLLTAPEALKAGLVTHVDYADTLAENVSEAVTGDRDSADDVLVDLADYARAAARGASGKARPKVALVYAVGAIMDSKTQAQSAVFMGDGIAAADEIAPAILDAAEDDAVRAIVLRVDSPGGSPLASESILRAVQKAKDKGKTVIVSMGATAASGGYWISAYGDRIFAQAATLTGSIGVLGGKVSAQETWSKLGVHWNTEVQWGANAGMWSINTPFSAGEAERINAMLDHVYAAFLERVAKGRKMTPEQVDNVARGRVWSGAKALEIGLVDEIGGLREALEYTAVQLGAADRSGLEIEILPRPKTPFEQLMALLDSSAGVYDGLQLQGVLARLAAPYMEQAGLMQEKSFSAYETLRLKP